MKESFFYKNYFSYLNLGLANESTKSLIKIQLAFLSNRDVKVVRSLVDEINAKFNKNLIQLVFLSRSASSSFTETSSFNFLLISKNRLAVFLFFDLLFKLNILFSVISVKSNLNLFSVNFFKAFSANKLALSSKENFISEFSKSFLFFLKKIELTNSIKFLKLLKVLTDKKLQN